MNPNINPRFNIVNTTNYKNELVKQENAITYQECPSSGPVARPRANALANLFHCFQPAPQISNSQPRGIYFSKDQYNNVAQFKASPDFLKCRKQFENSMDRIINFYIKNGTAREKSDKMVAESSSKQSEKLLNNIYTVKRNFKNFSDQNMFNEGKRMVEKIVEIVHDEKIPLDQRMVLCTDFAIEASKCSGGVTGSLQEQLMSFIDKDSLEGLVVDKKNKLVNAAIHKYLEYLSKKCPEIKDSLFNNEKHIAGYFKNKKADQLGLIKTKDIFVKSGQLTLGKKRANGEFSAKRYKTRMQECNNRVIQALTPGLLLQEIVDDFYERMQEIFYRHFSDDEPVLDTSNDEQVDAYNQAYGAYQADVEHFFSSKGKQFGGKIGYDLFLNINYDKNKPEMLKDKTKLKLEFLRRLNSIGILTNAVSDKQADKNQLNLKPSITLSDGRRIFNVPDMKVCWIESKDDIQTVDYESLSADELKNFSDNDRTSLFFMLKDSDPVGLLDLFTRLPAEMVRLPDKADDYIFQGWFSSAASIDQLNTYVEKHRDIPELYATNIAKRAIKEGGKGRNLLAAVLRSDNLRIKEGKDIQMFHVAFQSKDPAGLKTLLQNADPLFVRGLAEMPSSWLSHSNEDTRKAFFDYSIKGLPTESIEKMLMQITFYPAYFSTITELLKTPEVRHCLLKRCKSNYPMSKYMENSPTLQDSPLLSLIREAEESALSEASNAVENGELDEVEDSSPGLSSLRINETVSRR